MTGTQPRRVNEDRAREIAVLGLAHVARDDALVQRFVATSGVEPDRIAASVGDPAFLAGVLDFLLAHEPDAAAFAGENGLQPEELAGAHAVLAGGDPSAWLST